LHFRFQRGGGRPKKQIAVNCILCGIIKKYPESTVGVSGCFPCSFHRYFFLALSCFLSFSVCLSISRQNTIGKDATGDDNDGN
jgi:hypothetical protein